MRANLGRRVRLIGQFTAIAAIFFGLHVRYALGQNQQSQNPYSPAYGHPYRHGAVPTREAWKKMQQWWAAYPASGTVAPATSGSTGDLTFQGGTDGIGVVSGIPKVYVVFWGSQWISGGDPNGAATYLQDFYAGIGTGGETWSGTMTQYCDGSTVRTGATSCPSGAPIVGYPSNGALAGVWFDDSAPVPTDVTQAQIAAEAVSAAAHFGNTTAASNRYAQYVIAFPSGADPDGFPDAGFCAWHNYTSSSYGDIAYTNLPYQTDYPQGCGENYVNSGAAGILDGFSIVGGHEYAESLTDMLPTGGWCDSSLSCGTHEDGDECVWIAPGQPGGAADVVMGNGSYAMRSTWSNNDPNGECAISHVIEGSSIGAPSFNTPQVVQWTSLSVTYRVSWTSVSNATSYAVWELWNGYPSSGSFSYFLSSSPTDIEVGVPKGSWVYLEVQACHASECGDFSGQDELVY